MQRSSALLLVMLSALSSLGVGLLGPVYPIFVVNRLSASYVDLGFLYAVILLTAAFFKAPAGKLADTYGKNRVFMVGVMIGACCSLAYVFTSSLAQLYIVEFFYGLSHALERPSLIALIVDFSDNDKRGFTVGMFESVYDMVEAFAAVLSTLIVSQLGFEPLFIMSSSCQVLTGVFVVKSVHRA